MTASLYPQAAALAASLWTGSSQSGCLESCRMATHQDSTISADGWGLASLFTDVTDGASEGVAMVLQSLLKFNSGAACARRHP